MVLIRVSRQKGYVWDVEDVRQLRVEHHICGILTGSLPQVGQQNVFLGLPLLLLPEEVVLLVKNKIATIVDDPLAHVDPTTSQSDSYHAMRSSAITTQRIETLRLEQIKRDQAAELYKDKIGKRKAEKKDKALERQKEASNLSESFEILVPDLGEEGSAGKAPPPPATAPKGADRPLDSVAYTIVIQASSTDAPWYDPKSQTYSDLESAKAAGVWNYPSTPLQESRCGVFEDLWKKGYYMGGGLRFGGDFLIYPGDPLRYHSHFTLTVLPSPESPIMPLDLVAYGRLATAVKKAHLLGSWNEKKEEAEYVSLEWAAFG